MRFLLLLAVLAQPSQARAGALPGPITASVERVIDGDTFKARAAIWIDQEIVVSVRLAGVDAPELSRPGCQAEKERARKALEFTAAFLGERAVLTDIRHDKYAGRVVARVRSVSGDDLAEALVSAGLAQRGENGAWCPVS